MFPERVAGISVGGGARAGRLGRGPHRRFAEASAVIRRPSLCKQTPALGTTLSGTGGRRAATDRNVGGSETEHEGAPGPFSWGLTTRVW